MPAFIPQQIDEIGDVQAVHLASSMRRCRIDVPSIGPVDTAYTEHGSRCPDRPPVVLLHGFDGSLLEFRRLIPELEAADLHTLAVDLAGWGFTCSKLFDAQPDLQLGPQQKSDHLYEFWKSKVCLQTCPDGAADALPIPLRMRVGWCMLGWKIHQGGSCCRCSNQWSCWGLASGVPLLCTLPESTLNV